MSGFTLVIIVMLIMFAAVAIVMTQDEETANPEPTEDGQAIPAESYEPDALAAPEVILADDVFTESDTLRIELPEPSAEESDSIEPLPLPIEDE